MKGGTLCSKFALVELGLSELISFCKKWYIRDELCGLTKKKLATVIVGLFSLKEKAPTKKLPTVLAGLFSLREKAPTKNQPSIWLGDLYAMHCSQWEVPATRCPNNWPQSKIDRTKSVKRMRNSSSQKSWKIQNTTSSPQWKQYQLWQQNSETSTGRTLRL